jgi:hypothetical protein
MCSQGHELISIKKIRLQINESKQSSGNFYSMRSKKLGVTSNDESDLIEAARQSNTQTINCGDNREMIWKQFK